ncbi:MAG: hypothetical protein ACI9E1_002260 [Cryomorphaceae bacterium]|jgi:hypothetical protein
MTMKLKTHSYLLVALGLTLVNGTANGAAIIYESFNYSAGAIDGSTQNGGTGMTGAWSTSATNSGTLHSMVSGGLSFTGLSTEGSVRATRSGASGGSEMNRTVSGASQISLTADNTTIWFSILLRNDRHSVANETGAFVFGSGALDSNDSDGVLPSITGGDGFGVSFNARNPNDSTIDIYGYEVDGGTGALSASKIDNDTNVNTFMIAGKIDWAANGSDDTMTLYNISDTGVALPTAFASMTADLDQSTFNTLAFASRQIGSIDEIRFGLDAADIGLSAVPEPSSAALLGLGGLALILRRRR